MNNSFEMAKETKTKQKSNNGGFLDVIDVIGHGIVGTVEVVAKTTAKCAVKAVECTGAVAGKTLEVTCEAVKAVAECAGDIAGGV